MMVIDGKLSKSQGGGGKGGAATPTVFAHHSEREFARILDFYQIEWQYEPRTFHLQWDDHGNPIESFAPDFYLPELDLFIELTTLRQSLVTKKNRKLRRLRALYPDVNIKLFYNRDYKALLSKYGLPTSAPAEAQAGAQQPANSEIKKPSSSPEVEDKLSPE
jgi:hypothetical protein